MDREMININANLVKEAEFSEFEKDEEIVQVANIFKVFIGEFLLLVL